MWEITLSGYLAVNPAASSPIKRLPFWKATRPGDLRLDISLMAMEIGVWPGLRFTTAILIHSEPRSMLETADWEGVGARVKRKRIERRRSSPDLKKIGDDDIVLRSGIRLHEWHQWKQLNLERHHSRRMWV